MDIQLDLRPFGSIRCSKIAFLTGSWKDCHPTKNSLIFLQLFFIINNFYIVISIEVFDKLKFIIHFRDFDILTLK